MELGVPVLPDQHIRRPSLDKEGSLFIKRRWGASIFLLMERNLDNTLIIIVIRIIYANRKTGDQKIIHK